MRAAACFHGDGTGIKLVREFGKSRSPDAAAQDDPLIRIQTHDTVEVLAQINSKSDYGHWFAPFSQTHRHHTSKPVGGAGHPIKARLKLQTNQAETLEDGIGSSTAKSIKSLKNSANSLGFDGAAGAGTHSPRGAAAEFPNVDAEVLVIGAA